MPRPVKYRDLIRALRGHDRRFVVSERRGKGSHRMISHPDIDGRPKSYPIKCHSEGSELGRGTVRDILRRFKLPADLFD